MQRSSTGHAAGRRGPYRCGIAARSLLPFDLLARAGHGPALRWHRTQVQQRTMTYAAGGKGVPVLFLHGWGVSPLAYRRALQELLLRDARVIAPSLPGLGGSSPLPTDLSFERYAAWVDALLDRLGIGEPVVVIGHSFGGGVATQFAHDHPDRVRHLVLVNAVGSGERETSLRSVVDWALRFGADLVPTPDALRTTTTLGREFLANVVRDPVSIARVARLARDADLTRELEVLRSRGLPVLALTSASDRVIPQAAFEALCATIGVDGHVVPGRHSWLMADPATFGEVLDAVLRTESAARAAATAGSTSARLRTLLRSAGLPADEVRRLVGGTSPAWLTSDTAETLAGDLVLCHPGLAPGEVRAVARPIRGSGWRVTVVAPDRTGLLADTTAVLARHHLSVRAASAISWPDTDLAMHALTVDAAIPLRPEEWDELGETLRAIHLDPPRVAPPDLAFGSVGVEVTDQIDGRCAVRVHAPDEPGLLAALCRWFADHDVAIDSAAVGTDRGRADDLFLVRGPVDGEALAADLEGRVHAARR